jgi:hypothetical protein
MNEEEEATLTFILPKIIVSLNNYLTPLYQIDMMCRAVL